MASATIIAHVVSWPWPYGVAPLRGDQPAVVVELDRRQLRRLDGRGHLDVRGQADAEGQRIGGGSPGGLLGAQLVVAGGLERPAQRRGVVADVVHRADAGGVRLGERCHVVAPADLGRVDADLGGETIDHPLDGHRRFGTAGAAVGGRRHGVGDDRDSAEADVVEVVDARRHPLGETRERRPDEREGTGVLDDVELVGRDPPVPGAAEPGVLQLGPAAGHRHHVLRPRLRPAHGAANGAGVPPEGELLGIRPRLCSEAAADVGDDDAHLRRVETVDLGEQCLRRMGALARRVVDEPPVVGPPGRSGTALDRRRRQALVGDSLGDDDLAAVEVGSGRRRRSA